MNGYNVVVNKTVEFMKSLIGFLDTDARLSLEGDLSSLDLIDFDQYSTEKTSLLKKHRHYPPLDFAVLLINQNTKDKIIKHVLPQIGLKSKVIHLQIEKGGELLFTAHDNFDPETVWIGDWIGEDILLSFIDAQIIESYTAH